MTQIPTLLSNFPEGKTQSNTLGLSFNKINKFMCNVSSGQKLICIKILPKFTTKFERRHGKYLLSCLLWLKPIFFSFFDWSLYWLEISHHMCVCVFNFPLSFFSNWNSLEGDKNWSVWRLSRRPRNRLPSVTGEDVLSFNKEALSFWGRLEAYPSLHLNAS